MTETIQRIKDQLAQNHYVEASDIEALIKAYENQQNYIAKLEKESPSDYAKT